MIDDYDESSGWMFLLVPAHPGFPGQIPQSRKTVVLCCVCYPIKYPINTPVVDRYGKYLNNKNDWIYGAQ